MIELSQHIEVLLLENDCVIVPGFGGFVAHYTPATRVEREHLFFPPTRTIGFNPQLKLNDGVLVQSYMTVYDTNFSDATKRVEKEVDELIATLHEEGKIELNNVGEIRYTIHNTYLFRPYDDKITTPHFYGIDSFEIKELSALQQPLEKVCTSMVVTKEKKTYEIKINRTLLRNAVAMVAAVALFFLMSAPVENTAIEKEYNAQLLPTDLFEKIEKQSVAVTPVQMAQIPSKARKTTAQRTPNRPITVKEVKVIKATQNIAPSIAVSTVQAKPSTEGGNYHVIVAGGIDLKAAQAMVVQLKSQGFAGAKALNKDGKVRVSILSCATSDEANKQMVQLRKNKAYTQAWMLADHK